MSVTIPGWAPFTPIKAWTPVQVGTVTILNGCEMPNGMGALCWTGDGSTVKVAVVNSPWSFLADDVVEEADVITAVTAAFVGGASIFTVGADVYLSVSLAESGHKVRIFVADNPDTLASWTFVSEVYGGALIAGGSDTQVSEYVGIPHIAGSRWIIPTHARVAASFGGSPFYNLWSRIYTSDNGAAGPWTQRFQHGTGAGPVKTSNGISTQIGYEPVTDTYHAWAQGGSSGAPPYPTMSSDGGNTWTALSTGLINTSPANTSNAFVDDGAGNLYAIDATSSILRYDPTIVVVDPSTDYAWVDIGFNWWPTGGSTDMGESRAVIADGNTFYFRDNQVTGLNKGWVVGRIAW
jgi:hypothetical protein